MPPAEKNHLRHFLLFVFVLLLPCFSLWTVASASLATPAIGLVHLILTNWFPELVSVVYQQGPDAMLMTLLDETDGQFVPSQAAHEGLGFKIDTRILSYAIPFYAALHFATEKQHYLASFCWGLLLIYPFIVLGLLCICLKNLMVTFGSLFLQQPGVYVPGQATIGLLYQFSVLIIPPLVPALIWAWQSRHTPLLKNLLDAASRPAGPSR